VPNLPISGLTASATNLGAADVLPVTQTTGVGPVKMTGLQIAGGLLGSTSLTGATVTTSQPVLNLAQTWNAGAVTFTGLRFNATDTASAAASLLMDLQVGSSTKFSVNKLGYIRAIASSQVFLFQDDVATFSLSSTGFGGTPRASIKAEGFQVSNSNHYAFTNATSSNGTVDLFLTRRNTANLRFGAADAAAPVAQTLSVQSVVAGTTNTAGANLTVTGSQGTGSGAGGSIIFQVAPAGAAPTVQNALVTALTINSAQQVSIQSAGTAAAPTLVWSGDTTTGFYKSTGNIVDFSAGGAQAMRFSSNGFFFTTSAGKVVVSSAGTFAFSSGTAGAAGEDVLLTRRAAANLRLGAADAAAPVAQTLSVQSVVGGTSNTAGADFTLDGSQSTGNAQGGRFVFRASVAGSSGTLQNSLSRIADLGSMAVTGGATGRFFTIYDTFTDTSNFSRVRMGYNAGAGTFEFVSENAGSGALRALRFSVLGAQNMLFLTQNTNRLLLDYDGNLGAGGISSGDNLYDWGKTVYGNNRPRDLYVGRNFFLGAYQEMTEMTAPAAPAANSVRIYAVDNGSGKTQLMALFATGAAQQIAIEP